MASQVVVKGQEILISNCLKKRSKDWILSHWWNVGGFLY